MAEDTRAKEAVSALFEATATGLQAAAESHYSDYGRLATANLAKAEEYSRQADVASGIALFVEQLHAKNDRLRGILAEVEEADVQLTELEAVVATLDSFTAGLEAKIASMPVDQ